MFATLLLALQFKPVQTYFAQRAAAYLSKELKTRVEVKSLYLKPFKSLVLEGFYIQDLDQDTLLYTQKLTVDINDLSLRRRRISVNTARLDQGQFYLKKYKNKSSNLRFIINYFNTGKTDKKDRKPYDITFDKIVVNGLNFKYKNLTVNRDVRGINFADIGVSDLKVTVLDLDTKNHLAKAEIKGLSFREKSGFYLKNLSAKTTIDSNKMEFKDLLLVTPKTIIRDYLVMKFKSFDDFNHFNDRVFMEGHFSKTRVVSTDVAYFDPELNKNYIDVKLNGVISGYVKHLQSRNLSIQSGNSTLLKGNFSVKGLPSLKNTEFTLNFDRLLTTQNDFDLILNRITGNERNNLPKELGRLGKIIFKGYFKGYTHQFETKGVFDTDLGRIITDFSLSRDADNVPEYAGNITAIQFNLGRLLNQAELGKTSLEGKFAGRGFKLEDLQNELDIRVSELEFKKYNYQNIAIKGDVSQRVFNGNINVDDRNVSLNFNGKMDLNPELPVFNFGAQIQKADLFALNLLKDSIQVDGELYTNFNGNSLDNIQGSISARNICLNRLGENYLIDSIDLVGSGLGNKRSILVHSDLLEGSLKGQYDLLTLPSYFKSVIKKYIPSLKTQIVAFKPENFELNLNLKRFEPIGLFVKDVKLPYGAVLNGKFVSDSNVSTINGFTRLIQYQKIKANNLIIDEATEEKQMNIFLTSDRIDLTDSIFVKNVNIANILRNDSLSLNIKLSDKDAVNQLDLNALVEFSADSLAKLNILPSDVVINREVWKIQEKARIRFDGGKTLINNFGLARNNQLITLDGIISPNPEEELQVGFKQFNLNTVNPLTKAAGIRLKGEMNGVAKLKALSGKMRLGSNLKIDSLDFNDNFIGDLKLSADYDNETKLASLNMSVMKKELKTLDIQGTYDADPKQDNLDLDVRMDNTPIAIFEPVLKHLVSDLKGSVSTDLKVSGKLANPKIDGSLSLNNTSMTVNYLKTNYRISQKVDVNNTVIELNDLRIKDINNNEALANGTVDLQHPNNPTINVTLVANNFMALNTTAKDNTAYYGTAFGTGFFSFDGPTDNMNINIDARTEAGTIFNIPLNSSETISDNDFITFVGRDSSKIAAKQNFFKGLTMNFSLSVDEASQATIFTSLGRLTGKGKGDLSLRISSLGDFEMFGDYLISQGKFEFTAKDYINKVFDITQGGSIRWTGSPTGATINLRSSYGVRTNLGPLYTAAGLPTPQDSRVQAEAIMNLSGSLLKPDIAFDINFPTDSYIKDQLQGYLNDVNNVNQQALSLIVRRSFAPGNGSAGITKQINSTVISAGTEIAFNQLNNILSESLNLNFVDLNIRSLNEASASIRLLNDRLILTGGVTDRRNTITDFDVIGNDVARDVEAQYLINKDGSVVLRLSNRLNNRNSLDFSQQDYVSALGLVYRRDFDSFDEFLKQLIGKERKEARKRESEIKPKPAPIKSDK